MCLLAAGSSSDNLSLAERFLPDSGGLTPSPSLFPVGEGLRATPLVSFEAVWKDKGQHSIMQGFLNVHTNASLPDNLHNYTLCYSMTYRPVKEKADERKHAQLCCYIDKEGAIIKGVHSPASMKDT